MKHDSGLPQGDVAFRTAVAALEQTFTLVVRDAVDRAELMRDFGRAPAGSYVQFGGPADVADFAALSYREALQGRYGASVSLRAENAELDGRGVTMVRARESDGTGVDFRALPSGEVELKVFQAVEGRAISVHALSGIFRWHVEGPNEQGYLEHEVHTAGGSAWFPVVNPGAGSVERLEVPEMPSGETEKIAALALGVVQGSGSSEVALEALRRRFDHELPQAAFLGMRDQLPDAPLRATRLGERLEDPAEYLALGEGFQATGKITYFGHTIVEQETQHGTMLYDPVELLQHAANPAELRKQLESGRPLTLEVEHGRVKGKPQEWEVERPHADQMVAPDGSAIHIPHAASAMDSIERDRDALYVSYGDREREIRSGTQLRGRVDSYDEHTLTMSLVTGQKVSVQSSELLSFAQHPEAVDGLLQRAAHGHRTVRLELDADNHLQLAESALQPGFQQTGRILNVEGDRITQDVGRGHTMTYSRAELSASVHDSQALDAAMQPGKMLNVCVGRDGAVDVQQFVMDRGWESLGNRPLPQWQQAEAQSPHQVGR